MKFLVLNCPSLRATAMPKYHSSFLAGMYVRIVARAELVCFLEENWPAHHPVTPEQLQFADTKQLIDSVSFYHGGDVLYKLNDVPGRWHEDALLDAQLFVPGCEVYPSPASYYSLELRRTIYGDYVVVKDKSGIECLVRRCIGGDLELDAMLKAAEKLHMMTFDRRYNFDGTFVYRPPMGIPDGSQ